MATKRTKENARGPVKRKQVSTSKKETSLSVDEITSLGDQLMESSRNYNNFVTLIGEYDKIKPLLIREDQENVELKARHLSVTIFKAFQKLLKNGALVNKKSFDENKKLAVTWLHDKYNSFKNVLLDFMNTNLASAESLQIDMLEMYLTLIKYESQHMKSGANDLYFPTLTYKKLIETLLASDVGQIQEDGSIHNFLLLEFVEKYKENWDLQFYAFYNLHETLEEWKSIYSKEKQRSVFSNFYTIIRNPLLLKEDTDALKEQSVWIKTPLPSVAYKQNTFKTNYEKCFLTILSYPLLVQQYKSILLVLHKRVIPFMAQPQSLMDFLTNSYDVKGDGVVPILALNSLYELMKRYNLEYPDFYKKLYSLLSPELLYTKYRSRFFRLCDLFLSSTHLSASLVASFIKKLARLSISASATGIVIVIPFIYNLLKKHPICMIMLHNSDAASLDEYVDPYNDDENDPLVTNAINSSLWELEALMSHYHPNVATLAKIFKEPFRKHNYNMEDFLDWSYSTLLESEKTRKYKGIAALEFEEFGSLFQNEQQSITNPYISGWKFS